MKKIYHYLMNRLYIFIAVLIFSLSAFATNQIGDNLIWDNDTLTLLSDPLKFREDRDSLRSQIFREIEKQTMAVFPNKDINDLWLSTSACWRSYQAEWIVQNDSIFLNNIYHCFFDEVKINLNNIFTDSKKNEKIFASWITGELYLPQGECIPKNNCFFGWDWDFRNYMREYETVLYVENGLLKNYKTFQNRIIKIPEGTVFYEERTINRNINWEILPDLSDVSWVQVFIDVQPNEQGQFENVVEGGVFLVDSSSGSSFITDMDNVFVQESIRIAKMIPEWIVVLQRGKIMPIQFTINFTERYRQKFEKQ
jgi:hypothetical protein